MPEVYRSRRARLAASTGRLRAAGQTWSQIAAGIRRDERVNARLAMRMAHGWTQSEVAILWNERWPAGQGGPGISDKNISYWETWPQSGHEPSLKTLKRLAQIYQCDVGDLIDDGTYSDLDPANSARRSHGAEHATCATDNAEPAAAVTAPMAHIGRVGRDPLRAQQENEALWYPAKAHLSDAFIPDDVERIVLAARSPRGHDPGVVDALSAVLAGQRRTEDAIGAVSVIEPVRAQLAVVNGIVAEARGDLRTKILGVGSQWAQFAGWLHANMGKLSEANRLYGLALEWSTEADEPNMIATALNMQGHAAWLAAQAGPMIGLSGAAQRDERTSPGVRALAIQQEARGLALSGEAGVAGIDRKFDHAEELAAEAAHEPENEPPWIYFFSPEYLILQRGLAYRLLGEYAKANDLLTAGLSAISADMRKSDWVASQYLLSLAVNHAKSGDVETAVELAHEMHAIAQQTRADSLHATLVRFHEQMSRVWPDDSRVIKLGEALR